MADTVRYPFTRGDDFSIPMTLTDPANNGAPVDITGWTITSEVRYARRLVDVIDITIIDAAAGQFTLTKSQAATAVWPAGPMDKPRILKCDIQFDRPVLGRVSSKTFLIECTEDQTHGGA